MRFTIKKRARLTASMFASASFLALAVWGWELPVETVLLFFVVCVLLLALIVGAAAMVAYALHRWRLAKEKRSD